MCILNLLWDVLQRDIFAEDFRKERDDRIRVAGEKGQLASELEAAQQTISEMSAKLSSAIKEIDHLSAGLRQTTDELNRTKEEIAVKVAQVKQGNSIYIFATLLASLSSLDMLFSPCVLPIGVCKIAIHLYTL